MNRAGLAMVVGSLFCVSAAVQAQTGAQAGAQTSGQATVEAGKTQAKASSNTSATTGASAQNGQASRRLRHAPTGRRNRRLASCLTEQF